MKFKPGSVPFSESGTTERNARTTEWVLLGQIRSLKGAQYGVGTMMGVDWKGQWYPAQVQKHDRGEHPIHYVSYDDSWGDSWDDGVSTKRIRTPF